MYIHFDEKISCSKCGSQHYNRILNKMLFRTENVILCLTCGHKGVESIITTTAPTTGTTVYVNVAPPGPRRF